MVILKGSMMHFFRLFEKFESPLRLKKEYSMPKKENEIQLSEIEHLELQSIVGKGTL